MNEQKDKEPVKRICVGLLAHVDAGKTTLSEALLYTSGRIRRLGRVDRGDAYLDTYELEKKRGITIFSKQAELAWNHINVSLLDTPGHVDFSAEMERTLQVLDYALLVISGTDGVQGHTRTLWRLLARYEIPVFIFINKMDLAGERKDALMEELKNHLDGSCVDFGNAGTDSFFEETAVCSEAALEEYLETGAVGNGVIRDLIAFRKLFPCFFGSALRLNGVEELLQGLEEWTAPPPRAGEFGARVFKITRDSQGNRLTHMKITGGVLRVRDLVNGEKVSQLRIYSGEKFEAVNEVHAGMICAAAGLSRTSAGQGLGECSEAALPVLEPVLTYRVELPEGTDAASVLPRLMQLEEEEPELHIVWEEEKKEIHAQIMGEIQMEILKSLIAERFGIEIRFGGRSIVYKETILDTVEGVGHFEPLRHYAEVHLLLEPGEPGSGLSFASACSEDILDKNWQRLVLTHLEEKEHRGVLTGAPITDMRITLMSGRAHVKHTEGGDFRQAVYRAVRQGLRQARSALLEPWYEFSLEVPERFIGRAMTDLERRHGTFEAPLLEDGTALLTGTAPVAALDGYQTEVTAYSGGLGHLTCTLRGYGPCHNEEEVVAASGYDPDADLENPCGSVFCTYGAGFAVPWDLVKDYMHLPSCLGKGKKAGGETAQEEAARQISRDALSADGRGREPKEQRWLGTEEIDAILASTYYSNPKKKAGERRRPETRVYRAAEPERRESGNAGAGTSAKTGKPAAKREEYLLVDGYNIIFAWEELRELAKTNIDSARGKLLDILCNYQGIRKCHVIAVFDAYRVQGHPEEALDYHNIHVVFTREAETADRYIEKFAHENGAKHTVIVATSDYLEQIIIRGQGCILYSARELQEEIARAGAELLASYEGKDAGQKNYLQDYIPEDVLQTISEAESTMKNKDL